MKKTIKMIIIIMMVFLMIGCTNSNKTKTFLYLGGIEKDKELKLEYKICRIRDDDIYLSFEIEKYDSSIKSIRSIDITEGGEIKAIYYNSKKINNFDDTSFNDRDTAKIDVLLSKESKGEFMDIYIYQHKMITLYISEEAMPGYVCPEIDNDYLIN